MELTERGDYLPIAKFFKKSIVPFKLSFMYGTVICKFYDCYGRHLSDDASVKLVKCITVLEFDIYV